MAAKFKVGDPVVHKSALSGEGYVILDIDGNGWCECRGRLRTGIVRSFNINELVPLPVDETEQPKAKFKAGDNVYVLKALSRTTEKWTGHVGEVVVVNLVAKPNVGIAARYLVKFNTSPIAKTEWLDEEELVRPDYKPPEAPWPQVGDRIVTTESEHLSSHLRNKKGVVERLPTGTSSIPLYEVRLENGSVWQFVKDVLRKDRSEPDKPWQPQDGERVEVLPMGPGTIKYTPNYAPSHGSRWIVHLDNGRVGSWQLKDLKPLASETVSSTSEQEPDSMSALNNTPIVVENRIFVNSKPFSDYSDEQLYALIQNDEQAVVQLKQIQNPPKRLRKKIQDIEAGIAALVKLMDTQDGSAE